MHDMVQELRCGDRIRGREKGADYSHGIGAGLNGEQGVVGCNAADAHDAARKRSGLC